MRTVLLVRDGRVPDEALRMEAQWVDAATPTFAAQADGVVKLFSADRLLPRRASRRALGYSDAQIREMLPAPSDPADDEPEFEPTPARRAPVRLGPAVGVPPLAVQFREPVLAGR